MKSFTILLFSTGLASAVAVPPQLAERSSQVQPLEEAIFQRAELNTTAAGAAESTKAPIDGQKQESSETENNKENESASKQKEKEGESRDQQDRNREQQNRNRGQEGQGNRNNNFNEGNQNNNNNNRNEGDRNNNDIIDNQFAQQCQQLLQQNRCQLNDQFNQLFNQQFQQLMSVNAHNLAFGFNQQFGNALSVQNLVNLNANQLIGVANVLQFVPFMQTVLAAVPGFDQANLQNVLQGISSSFGANGFAFNSLVPDGMNSLGAFNFVPVIQ